MVQENSYSVNLDRLKTISNNLKVEILQMTSKAGSGHPGGSLSITDILAVLYFYIMKHDPQNPSLKDRDYFILSKGHCAPALYAALGMCGYFKTSEFNSLRQTDSILQGHPDSTKTPGVEVSTGSLGNGLSVGCGIASSVKLDKKSRRIFVLLGDGECNEGQVWEAAMFASHFKLDNLIAIVDLNGYQVDGATSDIMNMESLNEKFCSFNWEVFEIDGHDVDEIILTFKSAFKSKNGKPKVIIAKTVKGKGVSFMENENKFHGTPLKDNELELALIELKK